jgi:hypothetical protein
VTQDGAPVGRMGHGSEEGEPSGFPQRDQAGDEQAAEQLARDAHRQEEGWARRYPALAARRHAAWTCGWWVSAENPDLLK